MDQALSASTLGSDLPILIWLAILAMKKSGQNIAIQNLASAGLEVEYLTTDPDSSAYRAAMRLYADSVTSVEPRHLIETRHVSHNHRKYIKKHE